MANVIWREEPLADLDDIVDFFDLHDPSAAKRITAELIDCGASLGVFPRPGRPARGSLREMVTVPPYVLTYRVEGEIVRVVEVRHGAKLPRTRA